MKSLLVAGLEKVVAGCLPLASGTWSPVVAQVTRLPAVASLMWSSPVPSCAVISYDVLSCPTPFSLGVSCLVFLWMSFSYYCSFCCCCFHLSPLSLCLRVSVPQAVGVQLSLLPASLFRALVDSPGLHADTEDCTLRAVRALAPTLPCSRRMCIIAKRLGSLQRLTQAAEHRNGQLPNSELHTGATRAPLGNHKSPRTCVPALAIANRFFLHPVLCGVQTVSKLLLCAVSCHCPYFRFRLERTKSKAFQRPRCMPCGRRQLAL